MTSDDEEHELERSTLTLVNRVAYSSSSRGHARRFAEWTGVSLPTSDIRLLEYLSGRPAAPVSAIASALGIDLSQASRQVAQLATAGYVERAADPADRRRTLVTLRPSTCDLLDRWLLGWTADYRRPLEDWAPADLDDLERWFSHARERLEAALPHRPLPVAQDRWQQLTVDEPMGVELRRIVTTMVALVTWVGQSGGFDELLKQLDAPIRQHAYFTLRVVARHGPLSVADVADRMGVDHSQASKRLSQLARLGLVDRAVDAFDRRSNLVRASRKGVALERGVQDTQLGGFAGLVGPFTAEQRDRWTVLVQRYVGELLAGGLDPRARDQRRSA